MAFSCNPPLINTVISDIDIINYLNSHVDMRTLIETAVMDNRHLKHTTYCSSTEYLRYTALSPEKKQLVQVATYINNLFPITIIYRYYSKGILETSTDISPYIHLKEEELTSIPNQIPIHTAKFNVKMEKYVECNTGVTSRIKFEVDLIKFMEEYFEDEETKSILSHINFDLKTYTFSEKNVEWRECDGDQGGIKYECTDPTVHTFSYIIVDDIRSYFTEKLKTSFDIIELYDEDIKQLITDIIHKFKDCRSIDE